MHVTITLNSVLIFSKLSLVWYLITLDLILNHTILHVGGKLKLF